jgi:hypothetical protein
MRPHLFSRERSHWYNRLYVFPDISARLNLLGGSYAQSEHSGRETIYTRCLPHTRLQILSSNVEERVDLLFNIARLTDYAQGLLQRTKKILCTPFVGNLIPEASALIT